MPIPVSEVKAGVREPPEYPAYHESLRTGLRVVEQVFRDGEPETDRRSVHDTVHYARELYGATTPGDGVGYREDQHQGQPFGELFDHRRPDHRGQKTRGLLRRDRRNRVRKELVEDQRDHHRNRKAPHEDRDHVQQRFALVDVNGPDKEQVQNSLEDPEADQRGAQSRHRPITKPFPENIANMTGILYRCLVEYL